MERITLNNGPLSFTALASGPADGPVVVLLHGFPDNAYTFAAQLELLGAAGYRAIAPTLRGYECSSQPEDRDYRLGTLARDVLAWIDELEADKVHLVGHDWGAAITYLAGALAPERFHSLTTMAVPHSPRLLQVAWQMPFQMLNFWYMRFFQLPWIAEWVIELNDWAMLRWLSSIWSPGFSLSESDWEHRRETFGADGVKTAMLSYYRQNASISVLMGLVQSEAIRLKTVPVRTLAMAGVEDGCMDLRLFDRTFFDEDFPAGLEVLRIDGAGHFMHLDAPQVVNDALLNWLGRDDAE